MNLPAATPPPFNVRMARLVPFPSLRDADKQAALDAVNSIRAYYPWSQKQYALSGVTDVYLLCASGTCFGFLECTFKNLDLARASPPELFLHELHVAPSAQHQGVGGWALQHLMAKGLVIRMIVVNENTRMLALVDQLGAKHSSISEHTRTVTLPPLQRGVDAA